MCSTKSRRDVYSLAAIDAEHKRIDSLMTLTKATAEHNYRVLNILDKAKKDEEDRLTQGKMGIVEKEKRRLQKLVYHSLANCSKISQ